jgi:hypothetical protein
LELKADKKSTQKHDSCTLLLLPGKNNA